MTQHGALSIVLNIKQGMKQQLIAKLAVVNNDVNNNSILPFKKLGSIHFARFLICNSTANPGGNPILDRLVFTTNYDLPQDNHIQELVQFAGPGLWDIFSMCDGFESGNYDAPRLAEFFKSKNIKSNTFYVGVGNRSVKQICNENILRKEIGHYVDANHGLFDKKDALYIREHIIRHLKSKPELEAMLPPEPKPSFAWELKQFGALFLAVVIAVLLSPILVPFLIIWVLILFKQEIQDKPVNNVVTKDHLRDLINRETGMVQAQFSAVGNLKPGFIRLQTMLTLLGVVNFMAPYLFSKGKLSGIPTVHFARWLIINEGRQMLFLSNYDGNSESYLTDFINIAAKQLTLLFSHTIGYPKTYLLMFGGAKDAKKFMEWARYNQTVTNVWYSANKDVNVKNIYNNSKIKDGLLGSMSEYEAAKWLRLI
jgi:hypothetical protein